MQALLGRGTRRKAELSKPNGFYDVARFASDVAKKQTTISNICLILLFAFSVEAPRETCVSLCKCRVWVKFGLSSVKRERSKARAVAAIPGGEGIQMRLSKAIEMNSPPLKCCDKFMPLPIRFSRKLERYTYDDSGWVT